MLFCAHISGAKYRGARSRDDPSEHGVKVSNKLSTYEARTVIERFEAMMLNLSRASECNCRDQHSSSAQPFRALYQCPVPSLLLLLLHLAMCLLWTPRLPFVCPRERFARDLVACCRKPLAMDWKATILGKTANAQCVEISLTYD